MGRKAGGWGGGQNGYKEGELRGGKQCGRVLREGRGGHES